MTTGRKHRFKRQESWRLRRVRGTWRRPRGVTSRMRKEKGGWPYKVKVGYGTLSRSKKLHPRGLSERLVEKLSDLDGLDPRSHIVRFSARLGEKKRLTLLERARQAGLQIANPGRERGERAQEKEAVAETQAPSDIERDEEVAEKSATSTSNAEESDR